MRVLEQFNLQGKTALVTGGSRGLGLEIACGLREAGARVALLARRESFFAEALKLIPDAIPIVGNVQDEASLEAAFARVGPVEVLVNAAGVTWGQDALEVPVEKIREVLDINVTGAFLASRIAARGMKARGYGKILNIASVAGLAGSPSEVMDAAAYSASKGALIALTRDLAVKWGPFGIRVNALAPGFFPTRMTEKLLARTEQLVRERTPLGRIGKTGELAAAALYLCSPASDYVTGQVLAVDGGMTAL
ncbi:SDR family oxidoreductase [Meiothermus ruber]|jgi:gluconate 5-dehydrogenase|uniref:Short-chain dehydrogenase/reductase SDR n=1 Tax=Meiothermus ruber (strain ATCC 35948 / DSM 1279 / VKM B-1258 / 21) TaxID=504728 RepID=D3PRK1_MEIRD|nr:SDR family oxidoreductase [Meiothermus ruber]ADD28084.1 short-chain dehydrogenase/reductase SDR [Meiothermus ruber DSM 1279]AGK04553.1 short-chain dehydrogenase/reductase SDR [Meiothermus ruber DSM 1279]MCL6528795.1 SDR family oxidoreductase [Meiothermus ruber]